MTELIKVTYDNDRPVVSARELLRQNGRMMIHNILTGRGIVALMDRERA